MTEKNEIVKKVTKTRVRIEKIDGVTQVRRLLIRILNVRRQGVSDAPLTFRTNQRRLCHRRNSLRVLGAFLKSKFLYELTSKVTKTGGFCEFWLLSQYQRRLFDFEGTAP